MRCSKLLISLALASVALSDGANARESKRLQKPAKETREADEPAAEDDDTEGARTSPKAVDLEARYHQIRESAKRQIQTGQGEVHVYQLLEEMIDDVVEDVRDLNVEAISPTALRNVKLSGNLSRQFGEMIEAHLIGALAASTDITVKLCVACRSLRSRVESGEWVVSLGLSEQEDVIAEAERLGVRSFMDVQFSYFPGPNVVAMQVSIFRSRDSAVLWAETYRSDATTAAILRSGDRVLTRAERLIELERKLEARPYYGHIVFGGAGFIPYDSPEGGIAGAMLGYRVFERFGEDRRWMYAISAEVFTNVFSNPIVGSFIGGMVQYEVLTPNLNRPVLRVGGMAGGFVASNEGGNSFFGELNADLIMQFRLGAGLSLMYFVPVEFDGYDLGGFGVKGRVSFNW